MPYRCRDCRKYFSLQSGTLMEQSKIPLRLWGWAIYLVLTSLKDVSSMKLRRDLGVRQATEWFTMHCKPGRIGGHTDDVRRAGGERSIRQHDGRTDFRESKPGKVRRCIAYDGLDGMGIACRARSEVDADLRAHRSDWRERRMVRDIELLGFGSNACGKAGLVECTRDEWARGVSNPFCEAETNRSRPAPLLAACGRQRVLVAGLHQIRGEAADVVRNVDILREPADCSPHLG